MNRLRSCSTYIQWKSTLNIHWRTDAKAEAPILWLPAVKSRLIEKDAAAVKDWRQKTKGAAEDETVRRQHWLNGHEFEQTSGDSEKQGSLVWLQSMALQRLEHDLVTAQRQGPGQMSLWVREVCSISGCCCKDTGMAKASAPLPLSLWPSNRTRFNPTQSALKQNKPLPLYRFLHLNYLQPPLLVRSHLWSPLLIVSSLYLSPDPISEASLALEHFSPSLLQPLLPQPQDRLPTARVVLLTCKLDHVPPLLKTLKWLPIILGE